MAAAKKTVPDPEPPRRKPIRKEESVHVRLTVEQKDDLTKEATRVGLGLSTWLLMLGMREVQKRKEGSGAK